MGLNTYDEKILKGGELVNKSDKDDFLEKSRKRAQKLIRLYMKELARPERLEKAPVNHIASALATLVDKFAEDESERDDGTLIITHQIPRAEEDASEV